jgi:hypothetical protein
MKIIHSILIFLFLQVLVVDSFGQQFINRAIGGSSYDFAGSLINYRNGFLICGSSQSSDYDIGCNNGLYDGWLCYIDSNQNIIQSQCFGGNSHDGFYTLANSTNGFLAGGSSVSSFSGCNQTTTDYYVVAFDTSSQLLWQFCYGGSNRDEIKSILKTRYNEFIVAGYSLSTDGNAIGNHGSYDFLLVKIDASGNVIWNKCYGGPSIDTFSDLAEMPNGNIVFCGSVGFDGGDITGTHGSSDFWVGMIDSSGTLLWQKALGGTSNEAAFDLTILNSNAIIITGEVYSNDGDVLGNHGSTDAWIVKLDSLGNLQNQKCLGGSSGDQGLVVQSNGLGYFYLLGKTCSTDGDIVSQHCQDLWIVKCDSNLNILSSNSYGGTGDERPMNMIAAENMVYGVATTTSGDGDINNFHIASNCPGYLHCPDMLFFNFSDSLINTIKEPISKAINCKFNFSNNTFEINFEKAILGPFSLSIVDITGSNRHQLSFNQQISSEVFFQIPNFNPGVYFVTVTDYNNDMYFGRITF